MLLPVEEHLVKDAQLRFGIPREQAERLYALVFLLGGADIGKAVTAIAQLHDAIESDELPRAWLDKLAILGIRFPQRTRPL